MGFRVSVPIIYRVVGLDYKRYCGDDVVRTHDPHDNRVVIRKVRGTKGGIRRRHKVSDLRTLGIKSLRVGLNTKLLHFVAFLTSCLFFIFDNSKDVVVIRQHT